MPAPTQIRTYPAGKPGLVKPMSLNELVDTLNALVREVNALKGGQPDGHRLVTTYLFKPTANADRDGVYTGVLFRLRRDDLPATGAALTADDIGFADDPAVVTDSNPDNGGPALGINIDEIGGTGHVIDVDSDEAGNGYVAILRSVNADGSAVVLFSRSKARIIPVKVTIDGSGVAGSSSTTCTTTYTVKDLDGNELGVEMTPKRTRYANCEYDQVAANSPGLAYYDAAGDLQLYDVAGEKPKGDVVTIQEQRLNGLDIEIRTRDILVLEAADWSDWSVLDEGTECP